MRSGRSVARVARRSPRTRCGSCRSECPKLMVSTVASGDTSPYVGSVDVTMMYSVVDIAGINQVSARILTNAAAALAGMADATVPQLGDDAAARRRLDVRGHHAVRDDGARAARGAGLRGARLPPDGCWWRLAGGADQDRLDRRVARRDDHGVLRHRWPVASWRPCPTGSRAPVGSGIPQVVSLGALDMVNFGPLETVPERYRDRNLYVHNPTITLMRTTPDECREIARIIAGQAERRDGPDRALRPAPRRLDDRGRGSGVPRPGGGRSADRHAPRAARHVEGRGPRDRHGRQRRRLSRSRWPNRLHELIEAAR